MFMNLKTQYCQGCNSLKIIYKFNLITTKIPVGIFVEIDRLILKFI